MRAQFWVCLIVCVPIILGGCGEKKKSTVSSDKSRTGTAAAQERSYAFDAAASDAGPSEAARPNKRFTAAAETTASAEPVASAVPIAAETGPAPVLPPETHEAPPEQAVRMRAANQTPYRAGTLTAGSFDNNERYRDYREYLSSALQKCRSWRALRLGVKSRR